MYGFTLYNKHDQSRWIRTFMWLDPPPYFIRVVGDGCRMIGRVQAG